MHTAWIRLLQWYVDASDLDDKFSAAVLSRKLDRKNRQSGFTSNKTCRQKMFHTPYNVTMKLYNSLKSTLPTDNTSQQAKPDTRQDLPCWERFPLGPINKSSTHASEKTSTLRQRKGQAHPTVHHVIPSRDYVIRPGGSRLRGGGLHANDDDTYMTP